MNKKSLIITSVIVLLAVAGAAFYGGMLYEKSTSRPSFAFDRQGSLPANISGSSRQGGANMGEIISKDNGSITIKLINGGSKIIFFSDSTEINKFANGDSEDLELGKNVTIQGTANPDSSITAQSIQIRPAVQDGKNNPDLLQ